MVDHSHFKDEFNGRALLTFFALAFSLTWGICAILIFFTDQVETLFGEISASHPLFILAVYSPALAAVGLIYSHRGKAGLTGFFKRLFMYQAPIFWWLFLVLGIPVVFYLGATLKGTLSQPFHFDPWTQVFPALLLALFLGPIEEFGWRGLALPLLQRKFLPFWSSIILGTLWGIWHIPAFIMSGTAQSEWSFGIFFLGVISITVILTPFFNRSGGSLLVAYLYHFQMMNPIWPDAQPYDTWMFFLIAIVVVWVNRADMFNCKSAVVRIV